jgi:protein SCO1/2
MRRVRLALWVAVAVAAAVLAGIVLFGRGEGPQPAALVQHRIGGPFTLTGADGKPFSSSRLAGKPYAVFFGFTHCPDTCPTTLARLTRLRDKLPGEEQALSLVFVSVDPERDGPAAVGRYSALFGSPVIGLTGTPEAIEKVKDQFGIFSQKVATQGGDYTVDHTATVMLMDGAGRLQSTISAGESDEVVLDKLNRLVG